MKCRHSITSQSNSAEQMYFTLRALRDRNWHQRQVQKRNKKIMFWAGDTPLTTEAVWLTLSEPQRVQSCGRTVHMQWVLLWFSDSKSRTQIHYYFPCIREHVPARWRMLMVGIRVPVAEKRLPMDKMRSNSKHPGFILIVTDVVDPVRNAFPSSSKYLSTKVCHYCHR